MADVGAMSEKMRGKGVARLSFVIFNRLGSCELVRPGVEEESEVAARETVPPSRRLRT